MSFGTDGVSIPEYGGSLSSINKFGRNPAVAVGGEEEIWDGSAAYSWPATALMTHLSQAADEADLRGASIEIEGLDGSWEYVKQTKALDASDSSTPVTLDTALIRCFRMRVLDPTKIGQSISVHNAGNTQDYATILANNNQTLMAIYTVPLGKTAYLVSMYASVNEVLGGEPTTNEIKLWARDNENGYAAHIQHVRGLIDGVFSHDYKVFPSYPAKTDIFMTSAPTTKAANVSAGFDLILADAGGFNW